MPARRGTRVGLPPIPGGWGTYATLIAFGAAVSITGYFATGKQEQEAVHEPVSLATRAVSTADMRNESGSPTQPPASTPAAEKRAPGDEASVQIEWTAPHAPPTASPGRLPAKKPVRDPPSAGNGPPPPIEARDMAAEPQPAQVAAGPAEIVPAAPETQAPPTPDRWQQLAAAVSRCERENVLVGLFCKERARLQFCEGQWGDAPQCPSVDLTKNTH